MLEWIKYNDIASKFQRKAKPADREDLKQDIIVKLADIESRYSSCGQHLTGRHGSSSQLYGIGILERYHATTKNFQSQRECKRR